MIRKPILAAALFAPALAASSCAYAEGGQSAADRSEMQAALAAKVSMAAALKSAEEQSGGRAMEAAFTVENGRSGYEVTVVAKDGGESNFFVDATTGNPVKVAVTGDDEDNDRDRAGRDDSD